MVEGKLVIVFRNEQEEPEFRACSTSVLHLHEYVLSEVEKARSED